MKWAALLGCQSIRSRRSLFRTVEFPLVSLPAVPAEQEVKAGIYKATMQMPCCGHLNSRRRALKTESSEISSKDDSRYIAEDLLSSDHERLT